MHVFFFNNPTATEISTLSLHDALPIYVHAACLDPVDPVEGASGRQQLPRNGTERIEKSQLDRRGDRKSTRLNSSHVAISYAVFCLKKKIICPEKDAVAESSPKFDYLAP